MDLYNKQIYFKPWSRAGPYIVGLLAGYLLHQNTLKPIPLPKSIAMIGWLISTVILIIF